MNRPVGFGPDTRRRYGRFSYGLALMLGLWTVGLTGCTGQAETPDPGTDEDQATIDATLEDLAGFMMGSFSSRAQSLRDTTFFDIRLEMVPTVSTSYGGRSAPHQHRYGNGGDNNVWSQGFSLQVAPSPIPEPSTFALLAILGVAIAAVRLRRSKHAA